MALDFVLEVEPQDYRWLLEVSQSPAGQAQTIGAPPLTLSALRRYQEAWSQGIGTDADLISQVGRQLFEALFVPPILELWRRSLDEARRREQALRLQLRPAATLSTWPWELLYDPVTDDFIALAARTPLVRFVELPEPAPDALVADPPLRLLIVLASPADHAALATAVERDAIESGLRALVQEGLLAIRVLEHATPDGLQTALRQERPHVIHIVAHGSREGLLFLERPDGKALGLDAPNLRRLLSDVPTLRLAWLNSCHGAAAPDTGISPALSLVRAGLPAVLGMQRVIHDELAIRLAGHLYRNLAVGLPLDVAVAEGRKMLARHDAVAWSTPALFLRTGDSRLWRWLPHTSTLQSSPALPGSVPLPALPRRRAGRDGRTEVFVAGGLRWQGPPGAERQVEHDPFWLDETPVTVGDYARFVTATGHPAPPDWVAGRPPQDSTRPVVYVTWDDAAAYARWAGKRLPTATEWEAAARGDDGRPWPWGREWSPGLANTAEGGPGAPSPVGAYPEGAAPCGALDLAGNIWEWVADDHPDGGKQLKGGSWFEEADSTLAWESAGAQPWAAYDDVGFRCAADHKER